MNTAHFPKAIIGRSRLTRKTGEL